MLLQFYFRVLTQKKQYGEIVLPLQAVMEVMQHFNSYMDIPQVKQLSDEVCNMSFYDTNIQLYIYNF